MRYCPECGQTLHSQPVSTFANSYSALQASRTTSTDTTVITADDNPNPIPLHAVLSDLSFLAGGLGVPGSTKLRLLAGDAPRKITTKEDRNTLRKVVQQIGLVAAAMTTMTTNFDRLFEAAARLMTHVMAPA